MRISDWSSDVCSSDLGPQGLYQVPPPSSAAPAAASLSALSTTPKMLSSELPRDCRAAMAATDTRAAIRPYSMAVAPDSSVRKDLMVVIMIATSYARISEARSEEHTSELQSLMSISYAVFCLKKK